MDSWSYSVEAHCASDGEDEEVLVHCLREYEMLIHFWKGNATLGCLSDPRAFVDTTDKYVSRDGILDYLQALCVEVSRRTRRTSPEWCGPAPEERPVPSLAGRTALGPPQSRYCTEVMRKCT
jgi:hypothetical protein